VDREIFHLDRVGVAVFGKFLLYAVGGIFTGFRSCQAVGVVFYDFVGEVEDAPDVGFGYVQVRGFHGVVCCLC
jgi:hypothetical protein